MGSIERYRVRWAGFPGGPGVSTFYGAPDSALSTHLVTLFEGLAPRLPTDVTCIVQGGYDTLDDVTGDVTGSLAGDDSSPITGADGAVYAAPVGLVIGWLTDTFADSRRIQGRTFVVPLGGLTYQTDGTINPTNLTAVREAAATFLEETTPKLLVWRRPRLAKAADGSRHAITARAGQSAAVTAVSVPDRAAVLRSRRA